MNEAEEVDALLASWDERLRRVDENLIALESDATYQVLAGTAGKRAPLEGVTAQRVTPALAALAELFEHRGRLTEVLERATAERKSAGFFDKHEHHLAVKALLLGPSIAMGTSPTPLARRGLLDSAGNDVNVTPDQLLAAMAGAFDAARDAVTLVARAWSVLEPMLEALARNVSAVRGLAAETHETRNVAAELDALDRDLAEYRRLVATDPLSVEGGLAVSIAPRLDGVRQRLQGLVAERRRVKDGLASAERDLEQLLAAHAAARSIPGRASAELVSPALPPPLRDDLVEGLKEWRAKLQATAAAEKWHAADVGLSRWHETARSYLATDQAVVRAFEGLMERRAELEGRLSARRAQLHALTARGAMVNPALDGRAREAEAMLKRRPLDLAAAVGLVDAFEAEVVGAARRQRGSR